MATTKSMKIQAEIDKVKAKISEQQARLKELCLLYTSNLTKRQFVCFGSAGPVGIPAYLLTRGTLGNTWAMFLMLGIIQREREP